MQTLIIVSTYSCITPELFERCATDFKYKKRIISACISDSWLASLNQPAAFPENERAGLAEAITGVKKVHIVNSAADLDALQRQYDTHDMVIIDVPTLASVTAPRRLLEYESVPSHRPGYYPPAPA